MTALVRLRPGAEVFEISADELQIAFANYTATFRSPPVTRAVKAVLQELPATREELVRLTAPVIGGEVGFVEYVLTMLDRSRCLYSAPPAPDEGEGPTALGNFYSSLGDDPSSVLSTIGAHRVVVVEPADTDEGLGPLLRDAGLSGDVVTVKAGMTCGEAMTMVTGALEPVPASLVCWNLPYRLPFVQLLNGLAIEHRIPALFGACEGIVGRVGPYVLPGKTACIECTRLRLLSNAGPPELALTGQYRARYEDRLPEPKPVHPLFVGAVARLFILELAQIALGQPPQTIGGFFEYVFPNGSGQRRPVHRVPSCAACVPSQPRRFAWDVRFPAPVVKNVAE